MRYPIYEKKGKSDLDTNKKPDLRAQSRMLEGMLVGKQDGKPNIRNLLKIMHQFDDREWAKAADLILGAGRDPATRKYVIKELIDALENSTDEAEAAFVLGRIDAREAIEPLKKAVKNQNFLKIDLRINAARALGRMKVKEAIPDIAELLSNPYEAQIASNALLNMGEESVPTLIESLKEGNTWKRTWAAKTLGQFGSDAKEALPVLEKISNPWTLKGFWTRITDEDVFNAAGHAVFQIELSASYE